MGKISIYNTATAEHSVFTANGQLKDIFPDIDFKHSLCLKAGNRVDGTYEVQPEDVLFIRKVPGTLTTLAIAAVAIAVVGVGIWAGNEISKNKAAMEEMEKAQRDAQNLAQQSQQLPNIRGARNKNALGNPVQFVMGSVYNTPYNLTNGFYSIQNGEGSNEDGIFSFYNAVFSAGYGTQKITEVLIGNEKIASDPDGIDGVVEFDTDSLYYNEDADNRVEVRQPGANMTLDGCNQKVTSTYAASELKHDYGEDAVPVIVQAGENALTVQVCIQFNALRQYDSENEVWEERIAEVNPYWSNDGGSTWNLFDFDGAETRVIGGVTHHNIIERNSNHTLRFVAEKTFAAAESFGKNISIKVEKATPKMERNSQEDCSLLWYQTWSYDAQKSTSSTLEPCLLVEAPLFNKITKIAYRIEANDNTQDMLDELHCMSEGQARTWDGEDWSETKEETRNAGAWLLEVLTTPLHSPSKYEDAELDMASFGALYEYCEENDFYCDGILTAETSKKNLIEKILLICNSTMIINQEGLLEVCIDKEEDTPVALLNAENISGISYNKSLAKRTDGSKVTFTNRESWTVDTFYSMLDGGSYNYQTDTVDELALDYVTTHDHAYKIAQRRLRQQQLQPTELKADVGSEGDYYPLYSTVLVQIPQLLQGLRSSVITKIYYNGSGEITAFDIQDLVNFVSGSAYGIVLQGTNDYGFKLYSLAVTGTGSTRKLTLAAPLPVSANAVKPELGNHLSFGLLENGEFTKVTKTMKIYGIEPNKDKGITLTLRDYNEAVYEYGTIPSYVSNVTMPQKRDRDISLEDMIKLQNSVNNQLTNFFTNIYANHIVTLYKYSETDLSTTGIGTTLTYDFAADTITWGDPSLNNGWNLTPPSDLTDVWVTSATAHGQTQTDTINSNEWARPIKVGQNGVNGLNTCTISLYKRLSSTPQDLPATVTYNFANASMVCSNWNGWSTSIPEVDDEDFTPCWEIHATALSTSTTDTIESSEWSECAKILSEGLSKQDVLDLIGERINETPNVLFTPSEGMFAVDEDGIVSTPQTAYMDVRVIQNNEDIAFSFGQITLPTGMSVSATDLEQGTRLNFTVAQGTRLERNVIKVPVIFTGYADNDVLVDEDGNPLVWVADEDGRWYGEFNTVASLPVAVSGGFIYWNGIDTTASEELVEGGVFYEGTFYTYNGTKWKESKVKPIGIQTEATSPTTYDVYYTASIVKGGRYDGGITTVASIPSNPVIGDYFTWTGADQTPYEGSGFTKLASGCVYKWNGTAWEKDTSGKHLGTALPDILEVAESELVENNSDVVERVGKMIAWDVVTQNIKVTGEALINSAIIADLTLGDSTHTTSGEIKSYNYSSGSAGFRIKADGTAEFNDVTVRGNVVANSFTLGSNATITKGTDQSGSSYFGLSADGTLKVRNINAVSGNFTGNITATSLTLGDGVVISAGKITGLSNVATSGQYSDLQNISVDKSQLNSTIIQNNKIVTGLIDTNAIKATQGFFEDIEVSGTVNASAGRFSAGLGELFEYGEFLSRTDQGEFVTKTLGNLDSICGLLIVCEGDEYQYIAWTSQTGIWKKIYSKYAVYFYGCKTNYIKQGSERVPDTSELNLVKIEGDSFLEKIQNPDGSHSIQIKNYPFSYASSYPYQRHYTVYNLKIFDLEPSHEDNHNLSDNIRNYTFLIVQMVTNQEYDYMILPVSSITLNQTFARTMMANYTTEVTLPFSYQSTCIFKFPSNTTIQNKSLYNNTNYKLKVCNVWGIK